MNKRNIIGKLQETLERTNYVTNIEIFQGKFHEDSRLDKNAYISYIVNFEDKSKDTKLHELEKQIRKGFYRDHYPDCDLNTCIEELSETQEKHTINVFLNGQNKENKSKRIAKMAIHLRKVIEQYHFKR